jgi:hypothetical protein
MPEAVREAEGGGADADQDADDIGAGREACRCYDGLRVKREKSVYGLLLEERRGVFAFLEGV